MICGASRCCWSLPVAACVAAGVCALMLAETTTSTLAQEARPPGQDALQPPAQVPALKPSTVPGQLSVRPPDQSITQSAGEQPGQPPVQPSAEGGPAAAPTPDAASQPGFIDAFGRWLEKGATRFKSDMQGAQDKLDKFNSQAREAVKDAAKGASKGAADAVTGLPVPRAQSGRERCARADNGAPDCQAAAAVLCRGKGFQTGKSLDTQSEEKCPAKVFFEGRTPNPAECPTTIFVTRAMCQ
jgi:hypothetical protein